MTSNHLGRKAVATIAAGLVTLSVAGCSIGPVQLPDVPLDFLDGLVTTTSVADAEAAFKAQRSSGIDSSELVQAGALTVGLLPTATAPFCSTAQDGSYQGVNIEFAYAVGDACGLPVKFVTVTDLASSLGTSCDLVVGVSTADGASATGVTVMGDYAESAVALFGKKPISSVTDLSGKTVGIQPGSASQKALSSVDLGCVMQSFSSINEAMAALGTGSVEYVVCDAYAGSYLAEDYDGVSLLGTLDTPVAMGVAVSTAKPTLASSVQTAVDSVQNNGQLDIIKSRWVNGVQTLTAASRLSGLDAATGQASTADAASGQTTNSVAAPTTDSASAE